MMGVGMSDDRDEDSVTLADLRRAFPGYHLEVEMVPAYVRIEAVGCEECGTNDALFASADTRRQTLGEAIAELQRLLPGAAPLERHA